MRRLLAAALAALSALFAAPAGALTGAQVPAVIYQGAPQSPVTVVSAGVRSRIPTRSGTVSASNWDTYRFRDKTNVGIKNPWIVIWNGYADNAGAFPVEIALNAVQYRMALLTGVSGTALNQSTATVHQVTFFNTLNDPAFVSAGGTVSGDGLTVVVPSGYILQSDPVAGVSLAAQDVYMTQIEEHRTAGDTRQFSAGIDNGLYLGDAVRLSSTQQTKVYETDWTAGSSITQQSIVAPFMVLATPQNAGAHLVCVDGDSIISENADKTGDADGVKAQGKRALNIDGYSFVDVSVPGTNVATEKNNPGSYTVRAWPLHWCDAVLTDHLHNDRASIGGPAFISLMQWHDKMLRSYARRGAKVIRETLAPHTNSTDNFATLVNQTFKTGTDNVYPSGGEYYYNQYITRVGAWTGVSFNIPSGDPDGAYDMYTAISSTCPGCTSGAASGLWPVDGVANDTTPDGTHPTQLLHGTVAAEEATHLQALFGF